MRSGADKNSSKAQLRSFSQQKAERINRAETAMLNRRLKMMKNDVAKSEVKLKRQQKEIYSKIDGLKKNSGHSALRLKPKENDPQLKESSYFGEGGLMNEKKIQKWRYTEQQLQRQYKLTEMEEKKRNEYEEGLVIFLKDIGVIPKDSNVFKPDEEEPVGAVVDIETDQILNDLCPPDYDPLMDTKLPIYARFPYAWNAMCHVRPSSAAPAINQVEEFDWEADSNRIWENYIKRVTSTESLSRRRKASSYRNFDHQDYNPMLTISSSSVLSRDRAKSAPQKLATPSLFPPEKLVPSRNTNSQNQLPMISNTTDSPKKRIKFDDQKSKITPEEQKELQLMNKQLHGLGFENLPDWKRKVLTENPLAGVDTREKQKIRLTTSRAQMRRDLDRLVEENKEDLEKLTLEVNQRKYKNLEALSEAL